MLLSCFLGPNLTALFATAFAYIPSAWGTHECVHAFVMLTSACGRPAAAA